MKEVNENFFCREIQYAHIICSVEHGYIVSVQNENPYKKKRFIPLPSSQFYFWECDEGSVLKLIIDGVTKVMAFRVSETKQKIYISAEEGVQETDLFSEFL